MAQWLIANRILDYRCGGSVGLVFQGQKNAPTSHLTFQQKSCKAPESDCHQSTGRATNLQAEHKHKRRIAGPAKTKSTTPSSCVFTTDRSRTMRINRGAWNAHRPSSRCTGALDRFKNDQFGGASKRA